MKIFKFVLVLLVMAANLVFVPPSWADAPKTPKYAKNPDYIEVTQTLNTLLSAKNSTEQNESYTPEELQKKSLNWSFKSIL